MAEVSIENWGSVEGLAYQLLDQLPPDQNVDLLVGLGPAGNNIANIIAREPRLEGAKVSTAFLKTESDPLTGALLKHQFGQTPSANEINNNDVLVLDAVCRRGHKLGLLTNYILGCNPASLTTGVLYYLGPEASRSGVVPSLYVRSPKIFIPKGDTDEEVLEAKQLQEAEYLEWANTEVSFPWKKGRPASSA